MTTKSHEPMTITPNTEHMKWQQTENIIMQSNVRRNIQFPVYDIPNREYSEGKVSLKDESFGYSYPIYESVYCKNEK